MAKTKKSTINSMRKGYRQYSLVKKSISRNINYSKYRYAPLDDNKNSIRLLRIPPASDPSWPLECSLFHTTLEEAPPYVALSYTWGNKEAPKLVLVDSEYVLITINLKHALQQLRPKGSDGELIIWIDAICIDQENIPERNFQTANMRAIYQHATRLLVWVGLEYKNSSGALQLARDLTHCLSRDEIVDIVLDREREQDLVALVALFRRSYWWRIWVIQEVSSARDVTVHCGNEAISWEHFDRVCDVLKEVDVELLSVFYKHPSCVRTLTHGGPRGLQLSRFSPHLSAPPLFELLLSHKSKQSTDPKDKVYALVGVSSSRNDFGDIDYSLTEREIFTHTARHIITNYRKLDVICVKQHEENQFELPSWVPDWTRPSPTSGTVVIGLHHHEPEFKAAGDTLADFRFSSDGYLLHAKGMILDTIEQVGMPYKKRGAAVEVGLALEVFHDWWNIFVATYSDSLSSQAVFIRTISCGNWNFSDPETYSSKLETIFSLSDEILGGSDIFRPDPPSRSSTMGSSVGSLVDEEITFDVDDEEKTKLSTMLHAGLTMNRRRMIISTKGLVGLASWDALPGDIICVLLGCRFPIVLRPVDGYYIVVGEVYVDGFMNGEAILGLQEEKYVLETFEIR